jgi:hypothetical protein
MKTQSPDTSPEAERILIEAYRRMTPAEKLRKMRDLNDFACRLIEGDVRRRHPSDSDRDRQLRVASRYLPAEVMRTVFGWDPDVMGY